MPRPKKATSGGSAPAPRTSVSMDVALYAQLKLVAAEESERRGEKVSVADLVAQACVQVWLPSAFRPGPAATPDIEQQRLAMLAEVEQMESTPAGEQGGAQVFNELLTAAMAEPIPDVICQMQGTVQSALGPIKVSNLAYHLRSALADGRAICALDELIVDYQG